MKKEKLEVLSKNILENVGGEKNISFFTHCITRLRFNVKDKGLINVEAIKKIDGVLGTQWAGEQLQIIIGQEVLEVYNHIGTKTGLLNQQQMIDEPNNLAAEKDRSLKGIGKQVLDNVSGCLTPLIPMLIVSAMFKTLTAVFGENMLNILASSSDIYTLFTFVGDAAFYFLPIAVGYTSAKKFGATPIIGILMGAILIHPTFIGVADAGASFSVFGIPALALNYTSSIFPALLSVWVMSYVERFFNKFVPTVVRPIFAPFFTVLVMLPLAFCFFGPAGHFLGKYISEFFLWMGDHGGILKILAIAIVAALWQFLVMSGMHWLLISTSMVVLAETGQESFILASACSAFTIGGMCLGVFLRQKNRTDKSMSFSYIVAQLIGGITEPGLYGVGLRYKKPLLGMMAGGLIGGLYAGITNLTAYQIIPVGNFLSLLNYVGGPSMNFVNGIIAAIIAFSVSAICTYLLGFSEE